MRVMIPVVIAACAATALHAQEADPLREVRQRIDEFDHEAALPLLQKHLLAHPNDVRALEMLMLCDTWLRRFDEGVKIGDKLVAAGRATAQTYSRRGYCHQSLGNDDAATRDYRKAIALDPRDGYPHTCLGSMLSAKDPRAAMKHYDRAVELQPRMRSYWESRGEFAAGIGAFEVARESFSRALGLEKLPLLNSSNKAQAEWHLGQHERAIRTRRREANQLKSYLHLAMLAGLQWKTGREADAQQEFEKVLRRGDDDDKAFARRPFALMLLALGQPARTVELLEQASERVGPHHSFENALALWCARRATGADGADAALRTFAEAYQKHPDWVTAPVNFATRICLDENPPDALAYGKSEHAAMHYYLASHRARLDDNDARADQLLLHCVNTGVHETHWWKAARTELLRRRGADALEKTLGFEARGFERDGTRVLRVTKVDPRVPVPFGSLQVGDLIARVGAAPIEKDWPTSVEPRPCGSFYYLWVERDGARRSFPHPVCWRFKAK